MLSLVEALGNVTERTEYDTLPTMRVEGSGNWLPRLAALLHGGSQSIPVSAQGRTMTMTMTHPNEVSTECRLALRTRMREVVTSTIRVC